MVELQKFSMAELAAKEMNDKDYLGFFTVKVELKDQENEHRTNNSGEKETEEEGNL